MKVKEQKWKLVYRLSKLLCYPKFQDCCNQRSLAVVQLDMMKYVKQLPSILLVINLILITLAFNGVFDGKDMLPVLLGALLFLIAAFTLFIKRNEQIKLRILMVIFLGMSSYGVVYAHFDLYSAQKTNQSRDNSMLVLKDKKAPTITFVHSFNINDSLQIENHLTNNKYTIINFWATWCQPCLREMPMLQEFYEENKDAGIGLIGFTDYQEGENQELQKIEKIINRLSLTYPIVADSSTSVRVMYKADILPATVLVDENGVVLDYQIGVDGAKEIMKYVKKRI